MAFSGDPAVAASACGTSTGTAYPPVTRCRATASGSPTIWPAIHTPSGPAAVVTILTRTIPPPRDKGAEPPAPLSRSWASDYAGALRALLRTTVAPYTPPEVAPDTVTATRMYRFLPR